MFVRAVAISFMSLSLSGCFAPFAAGTALGGAICGTVANDRRSLGTMADDQNIRHQVGIRLSTSPELRNARIIIAVFNHTVLLTGEAPTQQQRDLATEIARGTPLVKRAYDGITLGQPINALTQSQDAWITARVHARFVGDLDLTASQFKVVTENGTVYLMGIVTEHQANAATIEAKQVPHVKRIVKLFEYAHLPHG